MRKLVSGLLMLGLAFLLIAGVHAGGDKKEVTLKGKITCAKCDLAVEKACHTVIVVKKDDKDVTYYFDKKSPDYAKNHKVICQEAKEGTVKGTVKKDGDKQIITTKEVKFKE